MSQLKISHLVWLSLISPLLAATSLASDWHHCAVLDSDGKYKVCWMTQSADTYIHFEVEVETLGYVGLGLSPNGGMAGSDIVIMWINDGEVHFKDCHAVGNSLPLQDESGDWELLLAKENDTHNKFVFRRKLDTCDAQDRVIDEGTMRLIYAYSKEEPAKGKDEISYHFENRGSRSVTLLQSYRNGNLQKIDDRDLLHWDVLSPNFNITSEFESKYWCKIFKAPELKAKHHIVKVSPLIQSGNEPFVHHFLLYVCVGANSTDFEQYVDHDGHQCRSANMPEAFWKCTGVFIVWGVGGEDLILPEDVGLPLEPSPAKYYLLEMHYDNPTRKNDISDQSGMRIYYTKRLRKYDAGTIMLGSAISPRMFIPPGQKEYTVTGHSDPVCLYEDLPADGVKILGVFLHSHLLGRKIRARHFRGNKELPPLLDDPYYDFNYQDYRYKPDPILLLQGDQVTVECVYDSTDRKNTTFGGESTRAEMCLAFLLYYPRIEKFASMSAPSLDVINDALQINFTKNDIQLTDGGIRNVLRQFNWSEVDLKAVEEAMRFGQHDSICALGNGEMFTIKSISSYPDQLVSYNKSSSCKTTSVSSGNSWSSSLQFLWVLLQMVLGTFTMCDRILFL